MKLRKRMRGNDRYNQEHNGKCKQLYCAKIVVQHKNWSVITEYLNKRRVSPLNLRMHTSASYWFIIGVENRKEWEGEDFNDWTVLVIHWFIVSGSAYLHCQPCITWRVGKHCPFLQSLFLHRPVIPVCMRWIMLWQMMKYQESISTEIWLVLWQLPEPSGWVRVRNSVSESVQHSCAAGT